ncbi:hypothetical protein [Gilvimarinus xylanilyticus]|uniref:Uncharacterized protein n=1 Tax=Gilvimarinus xylanilyticus TaxID=2944139 RepID=A0A9X2I396_9GAMM|nr:hypothetical protein [Gilvimarinus xylanilyticus]MCP8898702.1 hypothetical protein [Gilvimarinus xylanilyticus]
MFFADDLSRKFRARRRVFSISSVLVVLLGFGVLGAIHPVHDSELGWPDVGLLGVVAIIIYGLMRVFWRCPSCGASLPMGGITALDLKKSDRVECPGCGIVLR